MTHYGNRREFILDFLQIGNALRVTAVDVATGVEIIFQAPVRASPAEIERIARQKLKSALDRQKS